MKTSTPSLSLLDILTLLCGNLFSQKASITVQVRDPSGLPISGAAVSLALPSGHQTATGRTQAAGSVIFNVPSGFYDRFPSTRFQVAAEFMGAPDIEPETAFLWKQG